VHPVAQALLCRELSDNWREILKWTSRQIFSIDRIQSEKRSARGIKDIRYDLHRVKKDYIEALSDWLVLTDITRFYPSIYTHSIAWAAYGKDRVKVNIPQYFGSLADGIDTLIRLGNRNQTVGIPIGPESSRIVAEILSARIDRDFHGKGVRLDHGRVDRIQDDWFVGVDSLEQAENVLSIISSIYREYGLEINGSKTTVERVIEVSDDRWVSELGSFLSHRNGRLAGARLREFLSLCLRLQKEHIREPVTNYALTVLEAQPARDEDVESLESFLLKASIISPISMNRICRMILDLQFTTKRIARSRVRDRFCLLAERHITNGHYYEVIWLLHTIRGLRMPIRSKVISEHVEAIKSSALGLLLLDLRQSGIFVNKLPTAQWEAQINEENVASTWLWLLGYEGIRLGWLADKNNIMRQPLFHEMNTRNVVFYDERRNVPKLVNVVRRRSAAIKVRKSDLIHFLRKMRGLDFY
jgi:hypothetical protein